MINNNGWSQEHCNAITTRDKAAEVLKKEQADLSICKQKEQSTNATFCKFDGIAKAARTDWLDKSNSADKLDKDLTTVNNQLKTATNSNHQSALTSRKDQLTKQVAQLRKQAQAAKSKYETNKSYASAEERKLITIKSQELPKETKDVEIAKNKLSEAENQVKIEEQKDIERAKQEALKQKTESKTVDCGEGYFYEETRDLSDSEIKQNGADAEIGAARRNIRYDQSNLSKLQAQLNNAIATNNVTERDYNDCKSLIESYEAELKTCKDPDRLDEIKFQLSGLKEALPNLEKALGQASGDVKFYEEMISRTQASISQTETALTKIRQDNNMIKSTGNVVPVHYSNVTDVKAAFDAKKSAEEAFNNIMNQASIFERNMPSNMTSLGQKQTACEKDIAQLQEAIKSKNCPDSQRAEMGKQILVLQTAIEDIKAERDEIHNNLKLIRENKQVAKDNLENAKEAHKKAVEQSKNEQKILDSQYRDAKADRKYQEQVGDQSFTRSLAQDISNTVTDDRVHNTETNIRELSEQLSQIDDIYSEEYATTATQYTTAMNGYIDTKNEYFETVDKAQDAVITTGKTVIGVGAAATGNVWVAAGMNAGGNLLFNVDEKLNDDGVLSFGSSGVYGASDAEVIGKQFAEDFAKGAIAGKLGEKIEGGLKQIGAALGKVPAIVNSKMYKLLTETANNLGGNAIVEMATNSGFTSDQIKTLKVLNNTMASFSPAEINTFLKYAVKIAA